MDGRRVLKVRAAVQDQTYQDKKDEGQKAQNG
jgi:hypothetical protein